MPNIAPVTESTERIVKRSRYDESQFFSGVVPYIVCIMGLDVEIIGDLSVHVVVVECDRYAYKYA